MTNTRQITRALLLSSCAATASLTCSPAVAGPAALTVPVVPALVVPTPVDTSSITRPVHTLSDRADPSWGDIRTFWGQNTPFWGDIRTFWGDVNPYWGDIRTFWGDIRTFNDGTTTNAVSPLWGDIRTFSGDVGASWGDIRTFWGDIRTFSQAPQDYATLAGKLSSLSSLSEATFGAAVQAQTGQSFGKAFADPLFAKYGIDLKRPETLANLDQGTREHFFLDWYDGLMNFSGADHVDHWMKEANWSPALTQTLGGGRDTVIGLLDFSVTGDSTQNIIKYSGISTFANGHGSAVASLLVAAHDGKGVMGIAPSASVVSYNPFDATQTAGWADIKTGVLALAQSKATVINMSLGVPGWTLHPDWDGVFSDKKIKDATKNDVFVIAAGNDGVTQNTDIKWNKDNPSFIVVGSTDPTGTISSFSNRPGTTCLIEGKDCKGDYLKDHFITAPGELILVDDGKGGTTRLSGTSFAAPLVSGTIALIHDRWPWLADHPKDTVNIVLGSARDVGAPGTDGVYGVGQLDIQAALSPLDFDKLTWKQVVKGKLENVSAKDLRATNSATRSNWEASSIYFAAFENTGESFRDFEIPLSSKLLNQTVSANGFNEQFMGYLTSRFSSWLGAPSSGPAGPGKFGFSDQGSGVTIPGDGDVSVTFNMAPKQQRIGFRSSQLPYQSAVQVASTDGRTAFTIGSGNGAARIGGQSGFGLSSDYDVETGGANPFAGLASGGAYARVELPLGENLSVATNLSQRDAHPRLSPGLSLEAKRAFGSFDPYRASAASMTLNYKLGNALTTSFGYTMLHESSALLGMQSADDSDLPHGSNTDAATLGADLSVMPTLSLAATATVGRTRSGGNGAALSVGKGGLVSSAFQVRPGQAAPDRPQRSRCA